MAIVKPSFPRLQRGKFVSGGLVAAYPFYEGSGNVLHDVSGNGISGDMANGPSWSPTRYGHAIEFDPTDVEIPADKNLEVTSVTVTVRAMLTQFSGTDESAFFEKTIGGAVNSSYLLFVDNKKLTGRAVVGGSLITAEEANDFPLNVWQSIAMTYREETGIVMLFRDGRATVSFSGTSGAIDTGSGIATIGYLAALPTRFFATGFIADMRVYNRALSAQEIKLIAAGLG